MNSNRYSIESEYCRLSRFKLHPTGKLNVDELQNCSQQLEWNSDTFCKEQPPNRSLHITTRIQQEQYVGGPTAAPRLEHGRVAQPLRRQGVKLLLQLRCAREGAGAVHRHLTARRHMFTQVLYDNDTSFISKRGRILHQIAVSDLQLCVPMIFNVEGRLETYLINFLMANFGNVVHYLPHKI